MLYEAVCTCCDAVVLTTPRIGDTEAALLLAHLRTAHGDSFPLERAISFTGVLSRFRVNQQPG